MVMAHNTQMFEPTPAGLLNTLVFYLLNFGWMGVQLFFVLSGFLITGILLDTRSQPNWWKNFAVRRVLRIFPLYYGTLALIFVILPALQLQPPVFQPDNSHQWPLWLYLSNWTEPLGMGGSTVPHFWSLGVEEQFYLLWPLLLWLCPEPKAIFKWSMLIVGLGLLTRVLMSRAHMPAPVIYSWTPCRMDALALGGAAAAALRIPEAKAWLIKHRTRWLGSAWAITAVGFLLTRGFPRTSIPDQTWGYSILALLFGALVLSAALRDSGETASPATWPSPWRWAPLRFMGRYSYGMYVFHRPLHEVFSAPVLNRLGIIPASSAWLACLHVCMVIACSLALAMLSYHFFEMHFLRLKRHFT